MSRRTLVFVACSPHPRSGVSTTARLLTDFYLSRLTEVEGFDTDPHAPRYHEWFPDRTRVIDTADIRGQISLFDRLLIDDGTPKIVDVWQRAYDRFFKTVKEIGFVEEARARGVQPILLFHADHTDSALASAKFLSAAWPDLPMLIVQNEGAAPLGAYAHETLGQYPTTRRFLIGALDGAVAKTLDEPDLSLSRMLVSPPPDMSIVIRAALKAWIAPIFTQFRSFELRHELDGAQFLK
ncbi:hypothetical protein MSC49_11680 [Methylosinus sp. C49]|uniref:hypothetical protein n=1 Tax=Methylosinus sp. C49 TaxID=2699395 RepID=UPI0013675931|nr:hypothetical protein [Methylosinus sp. C49]BBU61233.1 hypothetical protein MSC49_11680 [Methylosinus sp. C49]